MNIALIKGPSSVTGKDLRQLLLEAFQGTYDEETDTWNDHPINIIIPESGQAPGTKSSAGAQICQIMTNWTQSQIDSLLEDASLNQYNIVGMQTFESPPTVFMAIENGTKQYLISREGQTEDYNWFPAYAGQSEWVGL